MLSHEPRVPRGFAHPAAATRGEPVANASSRPFSASDIPATHSQNHRTRSSSALSPPSYAVCARQSATSRSRQPQSMSWRSATVQQRRSVAETCRARKSFKELALTCRLLDWMMNTAAAVWQRPC